MTTDLVIMASAMPLTTHERRYLIRVWRRCLAVPIAAELARAAFGTRRCGIDDYREDTTERL